MSVLGGNGLINHPAGPYARNALMVLVVRGRRAATVRWLIAISICLIGAAGLVAIPSDGLSDFGVVVVPLFAAIALPIGVTWLLIPWSPRFAALLIVYADVGIVVVLIGFRSAFDAMPGSALLVVVALFVLVFASRVVLVAQTVLNLSVLVGLAVAARVQGADTWLVLSRALTLSSVLVASLTVQFYLIHLIRRLWDAQRDPATGLLNRIGLESVMTGDGSDMRSGSILVVASIVIDDLEQSQRRFGRVAGEDAVAETAVLLRGELPADAVLARTATAEFIACMWRSDPREIESELRQLETTLASVRLRSIPAVLRCGVGVAESAAGAHRDTWTLHRGIAAAELRRRSRPYPDDARVGSVGESVADMRARIQSIIEQGGPEMVFQPIRRPVDLKIVGYEALSRFPAPASSPQSWFADAREVGLGAALDRVAVVQALRIAESSLPRDVFVSINVAAATLLVGDVPDILAADSSRRRIIIEITEHDEIDEFEAVVTVIGDLRSKGIEIAVDDLGAGYAGLRQLVALTPDVIKLDASIVRAMHLYPARRAAAAAITAFARETGARTVFEGIETDEELAVARDVGADLLQGFRLGRPMPAQRVGVDELLDDLL